MSQIVTVRLLTFTAFRVSLVRGFDLSCRYLYVYEAKSRGVQVAVSVFFMKIFSAHISPRINLSSPHPAEVGTKRHQFPVPKLCKSPGSLLLRFSRRRNSNRTG